MLPERLLLLRINLSPAAALPEQLPPGAAAELRGWPMGTTAKWKPSTFNVQVRHNGKHLAFNSLIAHSLEMTDAQVAVFNDSLAEIERSGSCSDEAMLRSLFALGFIVPMDENEVRRERARFQVTKSATETLRVTIVPTMACNLHCSYCFQQNFGPCRTMQPDVQQGVVEFVRRKVEGSKALVVQWFGGEPLLRYNQILSMTQAFQRICAERGMRYHSEMLTNGTLLTEKIIDSFRQIALKAVQIPLDGDTAVYALRKGISLVRAQAFHRFLLDHMQSLVDATGSVTIRINVDRYNGAAGKEIVRMFKEHGCRDPRIDFRLGFLNTRDGMIDCIPHDCFSNREFADLEADFRRYLAAEGYRVYGEPEARKYPCAAPLLHNFTIDPEGRIGKCVPAIGTEESVFSRIYPDDIDRTMDETSRPGVPYAGFDPYDSACRGCELLPICLGSCPRSHEVGRSVTCSLKQGLAGTIAFYRTHGYRSDAMGATPAV